MKRILARIVAVADAIEAMSAERVYRGALDDDEIAAELRTGRGAAWDPRIVDLALESIAQLELVA